MKKGFTLIELLAVIVILTIIALIATPIVLNIINDTKESAILRSANFYIDALENEIMLENIKQGGNFNSTTCTIVNKEISCSGKEITLKVDGEVPSDGSITFEGGKVTSVNLTYSNGTVTLNNKGELVLGETTEEPVCTLTNDVAPTGISAGDKYQCKVKDSMEKGFENGYYFYVLSTEDNGTTNLIMDRNICNDGSPTEEGKTCLVAYNSSGDAAGTGPVTAMEYLNNATSSWQNIDNLDISYDDEGENFTDFAIKGKARMPYKSEVSDFSGSNGYLYENLYDGWKHDESTKPTNNISGIYGYWILSSRAITSYNALNVFFSGFISNGSVIDASDYGVRPVINLKL